MYGKHSTVLAAIAQVLHHKSVAKSQSNLISAGVVFVPEMNSKLVHSQLIVFFSLKKLVTMLNMSARPRHGQKFPKMSSVPRSTPTVVKRLSQFVHITLNINLVVGFCVVCDYSKTLPFVQMC